MRCPTCGNESDILEEYTCSNCGYIIQREPIERIPFFARREERWYQAEKPLNRIFRVIVAPSRAFWDINHKKKDKGPLLIKVFMSICLGLMGVAIHIRLSPEDSGSITTNGAWGGFLMGIPVFLLFFFFGMFYYSLLFWFYNWAFSLGANFSARLDETLILRYNVIQKGKKVMDVLSGRRLRKELEFQQQGPSLEALKEKGEMLTKIKQTGKGSMMTYAYAPLVVANLAGAIIALVSLPQVTVTSSNNESQIIAALEIVSSAGVWGVIDAIMLFTLAFWVPITMSLAMREIGNTSTMRLLIGNLVMGIILAYVLFFLRPTLGWNLNIISSLQ